MANGIQRALAQIFGSNITVTRIEPCIGGDINSAFRVRSSAGEYFVKQNRRALQGLFSSESSALQILNQQGALHVPGVIGRAEIDDDQYLILSYHPMHRLTEEGFRQAGFALAECHKYQSDLFGWSEDNFIGVTPQNNQQSDDWCRFFIEQRLDPLLNRLAQPQLNRHRPLLSHFTRVCSGYAVKPSLLHGDLWSGNIAADSTGQPIFFDPASYFGDRETDIAMTEIFGGFPECFYTAYQDAYPLDAGYRKRKSWYQLYHILNHAVLFGGHYVAQSERLLQQVTRQ